MPTTTAARGRSPSPVCGALPIAGITRRRAAAIVSGIVAAWIVIVFARQVGDASAATGKADGSPPTTRGSTPRSRSLERELELIGRQRYIQQQARGYGLGSSREIAFTLAADAPPSRPTPRARPPCGSVPGARDVSPLERWLTVLFGPAQ